MATIMLEYDARNTLATSLITAIRESGVFKIATPLNTPTAKAKTRLSEIEISMKEVEDGKINHYANSDELFAKLGI